MVSSDTSACAGSFKVGAHHYRALDEQLVAIEFANLADFVTWTEGRTAIGEVITDLGDAAFAGPNGAAAYTWLAFRDGTRAIRISAGPGAKGVGIDDLRAIADLIVTRLRQEG